MVLYCISQQRARGFLPLVQHCRVSEQVLSKDLKMFWIKNLCSFTTTSLQSTTSSLDNMFYPSVTVCNMNQIRWHLRAYLNWMWYLNYRDSFWRNIGIEDKTDPRRKMFVKTYFTGSAEPSTKEEDAEMEAILNSPPFQGAYCNYLIHTSIRT